VRRVLVVDDDADIRVIAELALARLGGFQVMLADSGEKALALASECVPDLILLDVSMPLLDGPATLCALRRRRATAHVPVIFFTAASSDAETSRLRGLGALGVLSKPFDMAQLARHVRSILEPLE
jgi:DNA-binding response OmpR family regulator